MGPLFVRVVFMQCLPCLLYSVYLSLCLWSYFCLYFLLSFPLHKNIYMVYYHILKVFYSSFLFTSINLYLIHSTRTLEFWFSWVRKHKLPHLRTRKDFYPCICLIIFANIAHVQENSKITRWFHRDLVKIFHLFVFQDIIDFCVKMCFQATSLTLAEKFSMNSALTYKK